MGAVPEVFERPVLPDRVGLRRRSDGSVLITGPAPGSLLLSGLTDAESTAVLSLGAVSRTPRRARAWTSPSPRWEGLLALLQQAAGRLAPAATGVRAVVLGEGPLPDEIRRALAPVAQRVVPESEALAALHADATIHPPDLVVLPAIDAITALAGRHWHSRGIRQLPVVVSGGVLHVGPLVRPHHGPCLGCLDLHRGARDPGWAAWQATRAGVPDHQQDLDAAPEIRSAAAALTAWIASGDHLDRTLPAGVSLSMERPHPRLRHHLWTRHPSCHGCAAAGVTMDS